MIVSPSAFPAFICPLLFGYMGYRQCLILRPLVPLSHPPGYDLRNSLAKVTCFIVVIFLFCMLH